MASVVFISHSGADAERALAVANELKAAGIGVRVDRAQLVLGESFLAFMEEALATSDYCLLLWSRTAAATAWVTLEWEAALHRSVVENRGFLVAARLEDVSLPTLIAPRLRVDFFPSLRPGIDELIRTWRADRTVEHSTNCPVGSVIAPESPVGSTTIYVTSEAFSIATPFVVDLHEPASVCLRRLVTTWDLPNAKAFAPGLGVQFEYRFMKDAEALDGARSLSSQGVSAGSVLWLETTILPYAPSRAVKAPVSPISFRYIVPDWSSPIGGDTLEEARALKLGRSAYLDAIKKIGLLRL